MNLPEAGVRRPSFLYNNKPTVPRPVFSKANKTVKRETVIGGAGHARCYACSALLPKDDSVCHNCGRTQIDLSLLENNSEEAGNLFKKRIKYLGASKHGYEG